MEQFFQGRNKIFRKNVPGTKIFTENFVPPERNSSDSTYSYDYTATSSILKTMPCATQDNDGSRVIAGSDARVSLCRFCRLYQQQCEI